MRKLPLPPPLPRSRRPTTPNPPKPPPSWGDLKLGIYPGKTLTKVKAKSINDKAFSIPNEHLWFFKLTQEEQAMTDEEHIAANHAVQVNAAAKTPGVTQRKVGRPKKIKNQTTAPGQLSILFCAEVQERVPASLPMPIEDSAELYEEEASAAAEPAAATEPVTAPEPGEPTAAESNNMPDDDQFDPGNAQYSDSDDDTVMVNVTSDSDAPKTDDDGNSQQPSQDPDSELY